RLAQDCVVNAQPRADSRPLYVLRAGRTLWVEKLNARWFLVYRQTSVGFMSPRCFGETGPQVGQLK
ncbi:MAG TPA: hypothetical protein VFV50_05725, partial [Bdellovibrionales bacterium]|nr:hypothetical protein [Bdellovibrionales bacterium]